jgi:hypothetical protein
MKIPTGFVRLSLVEAATRQTEAAIEALEQGQYDVALTLAGAAEGMIPRVSMAGQARRRDVCKIC